jgi:DNA (cytosine-5)-methyltransferase 1
VFVVAHLGEGSLAAKVLFESESVRRNPAPSREAGQGVATDAEECFGVNSKQGESVAETLLATDYKGPGHNRDHNFIAKPVIIDRAAFNQGENAQYKPRIEHGETMDSLVARGPHAVAIPIHDQATRNAGKRGDKQDGKGNGLGVGKPGDPCPTLTKGDKHAVLYENHPNDSRVTGPHDVAPSCVSRYGTGGGNVPLVQPQDLMAVRRLTPRECERLQGFPDDHTLISWRNKPADQCPDGPRYKALGNSMAVPCMAWIGKRIDAVEKK